ncbi:hypothetical protein [Actinophytocola sp. NPDC049390]|uniref:hypothetical protein n=1 Tax=Actinophytocola sp. NPDC049390 TaxID=3363894 RepID=UPI0037A38E2D
MLRDRGYGANASNQFDRLLDDYDMREVDLVILGGMVPQDKKEYLRAEIGTLNPSARVMQGLGGIAPLLVAQVEEFFAGGAPGVEYDAAARAFRVTLADAESVVVEGLWATFVPPEPVAQSAIAVDDELTPGVHEIAIPADVPLEGSYATVRVGERVSAFQIGETPQSVKRLAAAQSLPAPEPVTTRFPWE